MKQLITFVLLTALLSCTSEGRARETLEKAGYTDIEITGYAFNSCGENDGTCTGFRAKGPTGLAVEGAVGCGRTGCGKGCTIRFD